MSAPRQVRAWGGPWGNEELEGGVEAAGCDPGGTAVSWSTDLKPFLELPRADLLPTAGQDPATMPLLWVLWAP